LSGSGSIGGAVTINSGGIFAPGNPTGTLTVSNNFTAVSGAVLNYTLGTNQRQNDCQQQPEFERHAEHHRRHRIYERHVSRCSLTAAR
jgi:hypothetical protein